MQSLIIIFFQKNNKLKHSLLIITLALFIIIFGLTSGWAKSTKKKPYTVGIGDILEIKILQPIKSSDRVIVSPDGLISVPYIVSVKVKGKTINQIQKDITQRLADGFLNYPVLTVSLIESRSRIFTVSGQVKKPGSYPLRENTTVLKAISTAGGFTRFGSSSRVKVLRSKTRGQGYYNIDVNIKSVMNGNPEEDILVEPGDIIVISESLF